MIESFSVLNALVGGLLIGLGALGLMAMNGRIAGISGIAGQAITSRGAEQAWRLAFLAGLLAGVAIAVHGLKIAAPASAALPTWAVALAGVLVGVGTMLGSGCTSGHGVCGISRGSLRSIVATCVFMAVGALTVFAARRWMGL